MRPPFLDRRLERCPPWDLVTPADYSDASLSASDVRLVSLGCGGGGSLARALFVSDAIQKASWLPQMNIESLTCLDLLFSRNT